MCINDVSASFRYEQRKEGLRGLYTPTADEAAMLNSAIANVWDEFTDEISRPFCIPVAGVFCYDMAVCSRDYQIADAMCATASDGYYIGIARQALDCGSEYVQFLVIHELTHVLAAPEGHSPHYEAKLDEMLTRYNWQHGTKLKNDYGAFNDESEVLN